MKTYYFSHDINAHKDPKCSALIAEKGMTGYGIYWCLIEILHEQGGRIEKFPKLYEGLAFQLRIDVKQIEALLHSLINDYNLLKEDDKYIWSERVLRNLEEQQNKKLAKQKSGRIGGLKSGISRSKTKQNEALLQTSEVNEPKESKVNKIKEKKDTTPKPPKGELFIFLETFNRNFNTKYQETDGRQDKLKKRREKYTLEQILLAINNLSQSKFHTGKNDSGWKAGPDFLLRNDEMIDKWLNFTPPVNKKAENKPIPEFKPDLPANPISPERMKQLREQTFKVAQVKTMS